VPCWVTLLACATAEGEEAAGDAIHAFLSSAQQPEQLIQQVIDIVDCVGFKDELGARQRTLSIEAAVVQDADRWAGRGGRAREVPLTRSINSWELVSMCVLSHATPPPSNPVQRTCCV
jgi:hypothetical protein